jgi:1,4-alpha-glucan branching enzyme
MTSITHDGNIEFRFYRPGASNVAVSGDFNGWSNNAMTMEQLEDGWWQAVAPLAKGEYRFRYFVDGEWYTDFAANGVEQSRTGWNSVLVVAGGIDCMQPSRRAAA